MMKAARLMMLLSLMATGVSGAAIDCRSLEDSQTFLFNVTISWTYNSISQTCTAHKQGGGVAPLLTTLFAKDETKIIETVGNECLKFTCVYPRLLLDIQQSSCAFGEGCRTTFKRSQPGCTIEQYCTCLASSYYYGHSPSKDNLVSQLVVLTQMACVPALGPVYSPFYHPANWPAYPVYDLALGSAYPANHHALGPVFSPNNHPAPRPVYSPYYHPALVHPVAGGGVDWGGAFHWIPNYAGAFPWVPAAGGGFLPAQTPWGSGGTTTPAPTAPSDSGIMTTTAPTSSDSGKMTTTAPTSSDSENIPTTAPTPSDSEDISAIAAAPLDSEKLTTTGPTPPDSGKTTTTAPAPSDSEDMPTTAPTPSDAEKTTTTAPTPSDAEKTTTTTTAPTPSGSRNRTTPDPKDCSSPGMVIEGRENSTCADFTCVEDSSTSPPGYNFQIQPTGCYYNGSCYGNGTIFEYPDEHKTVTCLLDSTTEQYDMVDECRGCYYKGSCYGNGTIFEYPDEHKTVTCLLDSTTGQYHLVDECKGCYINDDKCVPEGHTNVSLECKNFQCVKDEEEKFIYEVEYKGCYEPYHNTCEIDDHESFHVTGDCSFSTCEATQSARWNGHYKTTNHCRPSNQTCNTAEGLPGCFDSGTCHPVKTVLTWSSCTQFVCYSDDVDLNRGVVKNYDTLPSWLPRATGCYGPRGCMEFGEEFVDINTGNTYRCTYTFGGLGHKFPEFHKGCGFLDGTPIPLGQSVLHKGVYYGCSHDGAFMSVPVNQAVPSETDGTSCGINPETQENMYPSIPYYFKHAICEWKENCAEKDCTYFDKRCYGGSESPGDTRSLGDKFTLAGLECVCTQDEHVFNYQSGDNPELNAPSLCAEDGVRDGACRDADSTVRRWGELWVLPGAGPLQICTCHPENRAAFCSDYTPEVTNLSSKKQH